MQVHLLQHILVYIIGNKKKNCVVPYDSCVFIYGMVRVFLVFDSRLLSA